MRPQGRQQQGLNRALTVLLACLAMMMVSTVPATTLPPTPSPASAQPIPVHPANAVSSDTLPACREDELLLTGAFGSARFSVEIARTPEEQARGLMFREDLPMSAGMLFVYDRPQQVSFWMRNTLIPLDMIFIDAEGRVSHIHENAVPLDETSIPSRGRVVGVFEINGGLAARIGIETGAVARHPALPQASALLPC